jgi:hypothetical protein
MLNTDLIVLIFWSFMVITIVFSVGVIWKGTLRILSHPKIIRNIVRLLKLAITKINKSIKKILGFSVISVYITSRLIRFIGITKLKKNLVSTFNSEDHYYAHHSRKHLL